MTKIKKLGREVRNFDEEVWKEHRDDILLEALRLKFSQYEPARLALLSTGERPLAEAAPRDKIYGIGLGASNPLSQDPRNWKGLNLLGETLSQVRDELKE